MAHAIRRLSSLSFSALGLLGAVACGGSNANTQAQTPATTTTTAATPAMEAPATSAPPPEGPSQSTPAPASGADAPSNLATPLAGSTMPGVTRNGPQDQPPNRVDSAVMNDPQVAEVIDAANNGEMAQARQALSKAKNPRVKQFAQHMMTDHGQAESKLRSIDIKNHITPQDSATSDKLKQGGDQVMANLRSASGSDFDKAYIDAQVDQHQKVVDLLDHYIPQAQNPDLTAFLKSVRTKVAGHLKMAQDIQASLNNP